MTKRPYILITNDDGVHAQGIKHLWRALSAIADVIVVAPMHEQSATSMSITIRHPLLIQEHQWSIAGAEEATIWSVNGTPADCVKLALSVILPREPDLIVSGINRGSNAGRNVFYSGTVAAVIEGLMHEIPGIAFSVEDFVNPSYEEPESLVSSVVNYVFEHPLPSGTFLNVNFPKTMGENFKGFRFAKQGREFFIESPEQRLHPLEGSSYYWLGAKLAQFEEHPDSDIVSLRAGYAAVVPIHIGDITHHHHFEKHRTVFEDFVNGVSCSCP